MNTYFYLCSLKLLNLINKKMKGNQLPNLGQNYLTESSFGVDYTWSLISTALLMSEQLNDTDKLYASLDDSSLETVKDLLQSTSMVIPGNSNISECCLLDSQNKTASSFNAFMPLPTFYVEEEHWDYNCELPTFSPEEELRFAELYRQGEEHYKALMIDGPSGCNPSIIKDNVLDIKALMLKVRNAIAHSNYEVIDSNYLRLYNVNNQTNQLDFNVVLNKGIILTIIDELNELASEKYQSFLEDYFYGDNNLLHSTINLSDNDIIAHLLSFGIFDEKDCREFLINAKKHPKFYEENEWHDNFDKLMIIYHMMYDKIRPMCDLGIIVNEHIYRKDNGEIAPEYYTKLGYYQYFNSDYYQTNSDFDDKDSYKKNEIKLLLLAFFNCCILNGFNINENGLNTSIDFSQMIIDENVMDAFTDKHLKQNQALKEYITSQLSKLQKTVKDLNDKVETGNKNLQLHGNIKNKYYLEILPQQLKDFEVLKNKALLERDTFLQMLSEMEKQGDSYNFSKNISAFILRHLRNSLAHGYVSFPNDINIGNIEDTIICFKDYDSNDRTALTFKGEIRLFDLFNILTSEKYVSDIFGIQDKKENGIQQGPGYKK